MTLLKRTGGYRGQGGEVDGRDRARVGDEGFKLRVSGFGTTSALACFNGILNLLNEIQGIVTL